MAKPASKSKPAATKSKQAAEPADVLDPNVDYVNTHPKHPLYRKPDLEAKKLNDAAGLDTPV